SASPPIESELELVEVGIHMLRADLMIRADDRTLEQRKRALNRVRMDLSAYPFFLGVIHAVVRRLIVAAEPLICRPVIGIDSLFAFGRVLLDEADQRAPVGPLADLETNVAAALDRAHHHRLVVHAVRHPAAPTHEGLVHFDSARERLRIDLLHGGANAMAEVPRGLVARAERPLE